MTSCMATSTSMDLKGKKIAVFGLGDQAGYGESPFSASFSH